AFDAEAGVIGAQVDGVAATARRLAADRAIAAHERIGLMRFNAEAHRAAMTGTLEFHRVPSSTYGFWRASGDGGSGKALQEGLQPRAFKAPAQKAPRLKPLPQVGSQGDSAGLQRGRRQLVGGLEAGNQ